MSWIKTDFDLGIPYGIFTIGVRELAACRVRDAMQNVGDGGDPLQLEKALMDIVRFYRPSLAGGEVVSIEMRSMRWALMIIHPSLPRVSKFTAPPERELIPCLECGNDMTEQRFMKVKGGQTQIVCENCWAGQGAPRVVSVDDFEIR